MRKSEFLAQLRSSVCASAEAAMAGTPHTTEGCPYLEFWFDYYDGQSSQHIERALRRYAPEARNAQSASAYIELARARIERGVRRWVRTGEITEVPEGAPLPAMSQETAAQTGPSGQDSGGVRLKESVGGGRPLDSPEMIQAQLGLGSPLESDVRSRMEGAFGRSFRHVRIHTGPTANRLSSQQQARAFTVGKNIAFGGSEYRPGTLVGDALLAHELAHVVQQGGEAQAAQARQTSSTSYDALEEDADLSAVGAMVALWGGVKGALGDLSSRATPSLRSGLRLQRCDSIADLLGLGDEESKEGSPASEETQPETEEGPDAEDQPAPQAEPEDASPEEDEGPSITASGSDRLVPVTPSAGCIQTSGSPRSSSQGFAVDYEKTNANRGQISLRQREDNDKELHTIEIPENPRIGRVNFPANIPIANEDHHYELEMVFYNSRGVKYGGLGGNRPTVKFQVCELDTAPTGDDLLFSKAVYAEGVDAGEFPWVRDVVYNRIQWVATCPGDADDFGTDIRTVLNAPNQFASVLNNSSKFQELEDELNDHSGACQYTTPPRSASPARCRLVNAAISTVAAGNGNTHDHVFFRSDANKPSNRAENRTRYPNGNYYWEISECPPDRQR
ncbi:MAG TPA: DUF4157 domain-containing protein [Acidobacteriota bacterium]|nr:DUF4157 domain-containing protein [Acidobacteriota bacterium]